MGYKDHSLLRKMNVLSEHANPCSSQPQAKWHFQARAEALAPALEERWAQHCLLESARVITECLNPSL